MDIVTRVKNICLTPNTEWPVIAGETTPAGPLITGYVVPLAAIGAVAGLIGGTPIVTGVVVAVFSFVMAIVGCFVLSLIINALAPTFGAQPNSEQALKVAVYSYTPAWVAGVLQIIPALGILGLLAGLYSIYLLYLGLPRLMKNPEDKSIAYTAVVVVCAIVLAIVIGAIGGLFVGAGMYGAGALGGRTSRSTGDVQFDKDSPMGKLQALGKSIEASNKKMEAAQKSGDPQAQAAAAGEVLGALLGGGKRVDPIDIDQLKPFVPDTFAGLAKTGSSAEKNGIAGLMVSKVETTYSDDSGKRVKLEVTDTGGVSGMLGLATWMGMEGEKQDGSGSERTRKVNGRLVHERVSTSGGSNEFGVVLGDRFVVSASGNMDVSQLKAAVSGIDLDKLESMKGAGARKP